ncbi:MAG: PIN domain nuclease [Acidobacteria bacterium]|nr:MAG: PIN domain nuclease [Acidobacteriota bacterium]
MKLLLDTHIWLWSLIDRGRLSNRVIKELEDPQNELWLSPVSTWELVVLCQKGRLIVDRDIDLWIAHKLGTVRLKEAPITHLVALELARIRTQQRDPADRFLVATAKVFDLTLVTADERLLSTPDISILAN